MFYDQPMIGPGCTSSSRECWTPIQTQLHILEGLYYQGNCSPKKPKIDDEFNEGDAGYSEKNVDPCENRHDIFLMGSFQARNEGNHEKNNMVLRHVDTDAHVLIKNCSLVNIKTCANDQQHFYDTRENVSLTLFHFLFQAEADLRSDTLLERT